MRILVVQGYEQIRRSLRILLELDGHAVTCARGRYDAQAPLKKVNFDLLIIGNRLADMSGLRLLQHLSGNAKYPTSRVLFYSTGTHVKDRVEAFGAKFVDKTSRTEILLAEIRTVAN